MSEPIVAQRKKWTKKTQKSMPGHDLRWAYGQLRDFGSVEKNFQLRDVPDVPVLRRKGGEARSVSTLVSQRGISSQNMQKTSGNVFIPIEQVKELSGRELSFLRDCDITQGYFDGKRNEFFVRRGQQCFRGRGVDASEWTAV
ncbi:MAG: hypothetical protein WC819_06780 [Parcubacteria group bacterium]